MHWFRKAAEQGHGDAKKRLEELTSRDIFSSGLRL
jgi:hypothetical protein